MFDAFPFDEWSEDISEFWTFGGESSTGTWILTVLGFAVMLVAFWGFVVLENRKLTRQRDMLRAAGALERPQTAGPGPTVTDTSV
jgi:hypothetical protein